MAFFPHFQGGRGYKRLKPGILGWYMGVLREKRGDLTPPPSYAQDTTRVVEIPRSNLGRFLFSERSKSVDHIVLLLF